MLTDSEIKRAGLSFYMPTNRIMIPVWNKFKLAMIQWRAAPGDLGPKYLTDRSEVTPHTQAVGRQDGGVCVIVEDMLSAIVVVRHTSAAFPLLGTSLSSKQCASLVDRYDSFMVWLDNDNKQVKDNARRIRNQLAAAKPTKWVRFANDPKHQDKATIINELRSPDH